MSVNSIMNSKNGAYQTNRYYEESGLQRYKDDITDNTAILDAGRFINQNDIMKRFHFGNEFGSESNNGVFTNGFEDPTRLMFKIEFGEWGSSLLDIETIKQQLVTSKFSNIYYEDYDQFPMGLLNLDFMEFNGNTNWSSQQSYNTYNYLMNNNEDARASYIKLFVMGMYTLQKDFPYLFKKISGVDKLLNITPGKGMRLKDAKITLECIEGIDLKIKTLLELYRKAAWDDVWQRWVLPDIYKYFRMIIYIFDRRILHTGKGTYSIDLNNFPIYALECSPCEIDIESTLDSDFSSSYSEHKDAESKITISVKNVRTYFSNRLFNKIDTLERQVNWISDFDTVSERSNFDSTDGLNYSNFRLRWLKRMFMMPSDYRAYYNNVTHKVGDKEDHKKIFTNYESNSVIWPDNSWHEAVVVDSIFNIKSWKDLLKFLKKTVTTRATLVRDSRFADRNTFYNDLVRPDEESYIYDHYQMMYGPDVRRALDMMRNHISIMLLHMLNSTYLIDNKTYYKLVEPGMIDTSVPNIVPDVSPFISNQPDSMTYVDMEMNLDLPTHEMTKLDMNLDKAELEYTLLDMNLEKPDQEYVQPEMNLEKPDQEYVEPIMNLDKPDLVYVKPEMNLEKPEQDYVEPIMNLEKPEQDYIEPIMNLDKEHHNFIEPIMNLDKEHHDYVYPEMNLDKPDLEYVEPIMNLDKEHHDYVEPIMNLDKEKHDYVEMEMNLDKPDQEYVEPEMNLDKIKHNYVKPQMNLDKEEHEYVKPEMNLDKEEHDYVQPEMNLEKTEMNMIKLDIPEYLPDMNFVKPDLTEDESEEMTMVKYDVTENAPEALPMVKPESNEPIENHNMLNTSYYFDTHKPDMNMLPDLQDEWKSNHNLIPVDLLTDKEKHNLTPNPQQIDREKHNLIGNYGDDVHLKSSQMVIPENNDFKSDTGFMPLYVDDFKGDMKMIPQEILTKTNLMDMIMPNMDTSKTLMDMTSLPLDISKVQMDMTRLPMNTSIPTMDMTHLPLDTSKAIMDMTHLTDNTSIPDMIMQRPIINTSIAEMDMAHLSDNTEIPEMIMLRPILNTSINEMKMTLPILDVSKADIPMARLISPDKLDDMVMTDVSMNIEKPGMSMTKPIINTEITALDMIDNIVNEKYEPQMTMVNITLDKELVEKINALTRIDVNELKHIGTKEMISLAEVIEETYNEIHKRKMEMLDNKPKIPKHVHMKMQSIKQPERNTFIVKELHKVDQEAIDRALKAKQNADSERNDR